MDRMAVHTQQTGAPEAEHGAQASSTAHALMFT